jgi:hypothetical protein
MTYVDFDEMNLPVSSGQVESAVRRVVNLRFKAPGSFWKEDKVEQLMHLRAYFKAGRWDELIKGVLTREYDRPTFAPRQAKASQLPEGHQNSKNEPATSTKGGGMICPLFSNTPCPATTQLIGIVLPKFTTPLADRFVRDLNAAFQ